MKNDWRINEMDRWFYAAAGEWGICNFFKEEMPAEAFRDRFDDAWVHWTTYVGEPSLCGSPIEAIFFAHAIFLTDGYNEVECEVSPAGKPAPAFGTRFRVQESVGKYRVDFMFTCHCNGKTRKLAVECDGHDFHERTKDQAARDRSRDRDVTLGGATIVRFTGSELYKDPFKCAAEVGAHLNLLMEEAMLEAGVIQGRRGRRK